MEIYKNLIKKKLKATINTENPVQMSFDEDEPEWRVGGFWEGENYKKVVRRVEDGFQFSHDISKMLQERAEIEMKYAQKLQLWSSKWSEFIEKSSEYGTSKNVLLQSLCEADSISCVHKDIREKLQQLYFEVKKWRAESYTKQVVGLCKEAKTYEDEFRKAQKPWARLDGKMNKYIKEKEVLDKTIKDLISANKDEQTEDKKTVEKLNKFQKERDIIEDKMAKVKKEMVTYRQIYIGDMTDIYERSQAFEEKRLTFIKNSLIRLHSCLDVSQNNQIPLIFMKWRNKIETLEPSIDTSTWSREHAVYEIFTEEAKPIEKKDRLCCKKSKKDRVAPGIPVNQPSAQDKPQGYDQALNPFGCDEALAVLDNSSVDQTISDDSKSLEDQSSNVAPNTDHNVPKPDRNTIPFASKPDHNILHTDFKPYHPIAPRPDNDSISSSESSNASLKNSNNFFTVTHDHCITSDQTSDDPPLRTDSPPNDSPVKVEDTVQAPGESSNHATSNNTPNTERKSLHRSKKLEDYNPDLNPFGD